MVKETKVPGLRIARLAAGIDQKKLAEMLSVSPVTVSRWETGARSPGLDYVTKMAKALNCSVAEILSVDQKALTDA